MSEVWSAGLSTVFESSQDELVERLRPQSGDRSPEDGGIQAPRRYLLVLGRRR